MDIASTGAITITNRYTNICPADEIDYAINYKNTTGRKLTNNNLEKIKELIQEVYDQNLSRSEFIDFNNEIWSVLTPLVKEYDKKRFKEEAIKAKDLRSKLKIGDLVKLTKGNYKEPEINNATFKVKKIGRTKIAASIVGVPRYSMYTFWMYINNIEKIEK